MVEDSIENPQEFLNEHDEVHIENRGTFEILTVNKNGSIHAGDENAPITVHITDSDVTVL